MEDVIILTHKKETTIDKEVLIAISKIISIVIIKVILIGSVGYKLYNEFQEFKTNQIIPVKIEKVDELKRIKEALVILKCPKEKIQAIAESIHLGSKVANVDPVLIAVLMRTESEFSLTAQSNMGYKGLMQTPSSTKRIEVDTMHGCAILKEKIQIAKGDIHKALTFYKGSTYHPNNVGYKQASQVITLYKNVIDNMKKV